MRHQHAFWQRSLVLSLIASALVLSGCGSSNKDTPTTLEGLAKFNGVWEQKGTGRLWEFSDEQYRQYSYNSFGCTLEQQQTFAEAKPLQKYLSKHSNTLTVTNKATDDWFFEKATTLPVNCQKDKRLQGDDPVQNFEFLWHHFNDYYAFFDLRNLDWQHTYNTYRPLINDSTSVQALGDIFDDILSSIDDSHISLSNGDQVDIEGGELKGLPRETFKQLISAGVDNIDEVIEDHYFTLLEARGRLIEAYTQSGELKHHPESSALYWAKLHGNIGYLRIERESHLMSIEIEESGDGIIADLLQSEEDYRDIDTLMQTALADLDTSDAIIIDLRINSGGYDKISQKIASYFNEQERVFATKYIDNKSYKSDPTSLTLLSAEQAFTRPVYVITGQSNVSAGEVLSLAFKAIPHVKIVGQPTNGSVSDSQGFTLPNGWSGSLSSQAYKDLNGQIAESTGVTPDTLLPVYASVDLSHGTDQAIDYIFRDLGVSSPLSPSFNQLDEYISQFQQDQAIPGLAVAVVHQGEIVYQQGYGEVSLNTGEPVTAHTPFNIGSISKAVLAVSIAQKLEAGQIDLDMPLAEMNLPFSITTPAPNNPITLRHLVNHTSGIGDTLLYKCHYFDHETQMSLAFQFGDNACSPDVITDPAAFYQAYFNPQLNSPIVIDEPGQVLVYSNVASGLAGFAIAHYLNIDLAQDMQNELFTPLSMLNTHWDHTQLSPLQPKAVQYTLSNEGELIALPEYSYPTFFDGDLNSSAHDLAKLLLMLVNGGEGANTRVLQQQTVAAMLAPQNAVDHITAEDQALFWRWNGGFIGHDGSDPGTTSALQYNPLTQTGYVLLMNLDDETLGNDQLEETIAPLKAALYRAGLSPSP